MTNSSYNQRFILFFGCIALFPFLCSTPAFAQGQSVKISPSLLKIQAKPPADIWTPFTIENRSDQPISFQLGYKSFDPQASRNGTVVFLKNGQPIPGKDKKIFEKIQVVDDSNISHDTIDLGPQQKERLRLHIILPEKEPSSDYYFSLIFLEKETNTNTANAAVSVESQKSFSTLQSGIGLNVLLAVGDEETPEALIDTFTSPFIQISDTVPFKLAITNTGTHYITPHETIMIKNMFGQTVDTIKLQSSVLLAGTSRTLSSTSNMSNANLPFDASQEETDQNKPLILWHKGFLLGVYSANLTLALSDKGPVYSKTIHFIAIPLFPLIEVIILIAFISLIYIRVKRKLL